MNKEIIKLTEEIGKFHIKIAMLKVEIVKLRAKKEVAKAKRYEIEQEEFKKDMKKLTTR